MAYNNRAWSEEAAGSLPAAIADCDKSLKIKSTSATAYDTKAVASILMGQEKQAEDLLSKAIKLNSKDGAFYYHRAVARSRISNAAVSDASIAEDLGAYKKYGYEPEGWEPKLNTSMSN
jgi:tetratricopeptide (TPR) repeat protein